MAKALSIPEKVTVPEMMEAKQSFDRLLDSLGIAGRAIPPRDLRALSRRTRLEANELSRDVIAAREE